MKKKAKSLIALLITIIFTVIVVNQVNIEEMTETFKMFNVKYLLCLVPFFMVIMTLRAIRWKVLLPENKCSFYNLYEIYMTSNLINIFLPARAGDIFRGVYFGHKYNLSKMNVLGTVAAERILDGLTVIFILLMGILMYNKSELAVKLAVIASLLFFGSFFIVLWVYKNNKVDAVCTFVKENIGFLPEKIRKKIVSLIDKLNPFLNSFIKGFETFATPKKMFWAVIFSILSWAGDCLFIYLLVLACGIKASFVMSFFVISFIALSTIIPSSSIYIGLYQYSFILALGLFGVDKSPSLSIALLQQGIMLIAYIIISGIFVFRKNISFKELRADANE